MSDQESSDRRGAQPGSGVGGGGERRPESDSNAAGERGAELMPMEASYSEPGRVSMVDMGGERKPPAGKRPGKRSTPDTILEEAASPTRAQRQARDQARDQARRESARRESRRDDAPVFYVAGLWHRLAAAFVDLAVIVPATLVMYALVSRVGGVGLPASRHYGVDFWLDLLLAGDPALITLVALLVAVATIYVLVFQITMSRTPGMRVSKIRIVDQYGETPSTARVAARTAGYLAAAATLGLGFIWIGFDSEKRGLHDWLSGTYVVRA